MTGAETLLQTLVANDIDTCFMNPGTSEMHFVSALDHVPGMRGILCLYEGVCSGAADGYARIAGKPASTLLHLGPGLGNGLSNFHNARKARTPIVSIVGEHSSAHLKYDAPLTSDIAAFARTVSDEVRTVAGPESIGQSASETIAAAVALPGQIAMLIVPADYSWSPAGEPGPAVVRPVRALAAVGATLELLRSGKQTGILMGGTSVNPRALNAARKLAAAYGVQFFVDRGAACVSAGRSRFTALRVPYFPEDAGAALSGLEHLLLVEAQAPVSFFGYPNTPGSPVPDSCAVSTLAQRDEDGTAALETLAFGLPDVAVEEPAIPELPGAGPLTPDAIGRIVAHFLPENAIVSDEMISSAVPVLRHLAFAADHEQLTITGGAIGQGLPVAVGAAIAAPDRKIVALEADGSAMYSIQSLWTMARENLDVTVVIFANRRYRILDIEMQRTGAHGIGHFANEMLDLGRPELDFVSLSQGLGVPATRAATTEAFAEQFRAAVAVNGPRLIEAIL